MRLLFSLILSATLVLFAPLAHAQTTDDLQKQISELLGQVSQLQTLLQGAGVPAAGAPAQPGYPVTPAPSQGQITTAPSTTSSASCLSLSRDLRPGSQGEDVTRLQTFLAKDPAIYPEGQVTGYYGGLTQAAVQRWQVKYGIVTSGTPESTGYGMVGPKTRRSFAGCGEILPASFGGFMRVTPISGPAPLSVSIAATVNTARSCDAGRYRIDFGDGTPNAEIMVPTRACKELEQMVPHTYTQPGTYTVALGIGTHRSTVVVSVSGEGGVVPPTPGTSGDGTCGAVPIAPPAVSCVGVWERVYNSNGCQTQWKCSGIEPLIITPTSGPLPLTSFVTFNIRGGDPYELTWSDGTQNTVSGTLVADLPSLPYASIVFPPINQQVRAAHTFNKTGSFAVGLRVGSYEKEGPQWVWRVRRYGANVNITGTNQADKLTVANPFGPAPFSAQFTAVINGAGSCSAGTYTLDFGDGERVPLVHSEGGCAPRTFNVTHVYPTQGNFVAKLYKGSTAQVTTGGATMVGTVSIGVTGASGSGGSGGSVTGPFSVRAGVNGNPARVEVIFTLPTAETCSSYEVDWGDGTSMQRHDAGGSQSCPSAMVTKTFNHTYQNDGTYIIKLRRGTGALNNLGTQENATVTIVGA